MNTNIENMSMDLQALYDACEQMTPSRHRMYNSIVALNKVRLELNEGETWRGAGASASLEAFTKILAAILLEEKRLNQLAYTLSLYADELLANEQKTAQAAQNLDGISSTGGTI